MSGAIKVVLAAFVVLAIAAVCIGSLMAITHTGYWALRKDDAAQNSQVVQNGTDYQQGHIADVENQINDIHKVRLSLANGGNPAGKGLLVSEVDSACGEASTITPSLEPASVASWVAANCSGSSHSDTSPEIQ